MSFYAHVNGIEITSGEVFVPYAGAWFADVVLADVADLSGHVTLTVGSLELSGTVDPAMSGTRGEQSFARIVAGAGGWATLLPPVHYHADNGVRALLVAQDAARLAGETLGTFAPSSASVGIDYARQSGPASRALEVAAGTAAWWVDYDGVTHVGTRSTSAIPAASYEMIEFDPRQRIATLALDDVSLVGVGSVLTDAFDTPQTVRDFSIRIAEDSVRVIVWTGESERARGRLVGLVESIVESIVNRRAHGPHRCRVIRMATDRVEVQPVRSDLGLPEMLPISMWPGLAGVHAQLTPGAEVLVDFIDGDRTQPIVTHFAGKDGVGFVPVRIDIGDAPTSYIALADLVATELAAFRSWANSHTHSGVTTGGGVTGTATPKGAIGSVASTLVRSK